MRATVNIMDTRAMFRMNLAFYVGSMLFPFYRSLYKIRVLLSYSHPGVDRNIFCHIPHILSTSGWFYANHADRGFHAEVLRAIRPSDEFGGLRLLSAGGLRDRSGHLRDDS